MVLSENIKICVKCLRQAGRCKCHGTKTTVPPIFLETLRILKMKGWVVERWTINNKPIEVAKKNLLDNCLIQLWFFLFAPPPLSKHRYVNPEFVSSRPTMVSSGSTTYDSLIALYKWVKDIPVFAMPFGQGLCDKCLSQGADWYFSRVNCPKMKNVVQGIPRPIIMMSPVFVNFAHEPPQCCAYLVEQKMTMPDRIAEMERKGYFAKNPIAKRKCSQWMKCNI